MILKKHFEMCFILFYLILFCFYNKLHYLFSTFTFTRTFLENIGKKTFFFVYNSMYYECQVFSRNYMASFSTIFSSPRTLVQYNDKNFSKNRKIEKKLILKM